MRLAAAYIRVSTDDQIEFSPESQLKAIKDYAQKNEMSLPEKFIFSDEGISGRNASKRPAFNKMIALAKKKPKPFDIILVWKYSRFARNREDSVVYKSMLRKELGIDVISVSEDVGNDKMSVLFEAMIEAMDEYYSINLAEEVKRGMTEKAKRGGVLSVPAFGYTIREGKYVIAPAEAAVIRKVFDDYNSGKGFLTIAKELNSMGIKTHHGNRIETRTVEYWLNNPVYTGKIRWNPNGALSRNYNANTAIISEGEHDAIIDADTWNMTQERLRNQREKYRRYFIGSGKDLSHWLVGIVRCGKCGAVLSNQGGYFGCAKRGKGLCEGNGYISAKKLESIVIKALTDILPENMNVIVQKKLCNPKEEIDLRKMQLECLEKKLLRVRAAYEEGIDTLEEYRENKANILNEIEQIKTSTICENSEANSQVKAETVRLTELLQNKSVSNSDKNKALRCVFKEILKGGQDGKLLEFVLRE